MDLSKYLSAKKDAVNEALLRLLTPKSEHPRVLHEAMHYSVFAGGKRIRPVLALAACEAVGASFEAAMDAACAIECIHTYSLIHDDLPALDNDDLRRGRPTCHKVYGEAVAILAGDALLTAAFEILGGEGREPSKAAWCVGELARAAGSTGMIGGQVVDIQSEGKDVGFPEVEYIHIHKTGELIRASVRCGAHLGGASDLDMKALTRYGEAVGLAFQIADDVLDVEGDAGELGKNVKGDSKKGKATYPALLGLEESKRRADDLVAIAVEALAPFDAKADPLRAIARYITARRS